MESSCRLPAEIIVQILSILPARDLVRCRMVSTEFYSIVNNTTTLEYVIELDFSGYERTACPRGPTIESLKSLRAVLQRWRNPQPTALQTVNILPLPWHGGIFEASWSVHNDVVVGRPSSTDGTVGPMFSTSRVEYIDLHRVYTGRDYQVEVFDTSAQDIVFTDFQVDHSQDVIILIGPDVWSNPPPQLSFMSLRSGKPHPRAQECTIHLPSCTSSDVVETTRILHISGDYLAVAVSTELLSIPNQSNILLYHWPSASFLASWKSSLQTSYEDAILVGSLYILLVGIEYGRNTRAFVKVYAVSCSAPDPAHTESPLLAVFYLPQYPHTSTVPRGMYWSAQISAPKPSVDFQPSPSMLLHLKVNYIYSLFTLRSTFLSREVLEKPPDTAPLVFEWEAWGPSSTRVIYSGDERHECDVIGYRVVFLRLNMIWDFNPNTIAQNNWKETAQNIESGELHLDPLTHSSTTDFADGKITTSLPYRTTKLALPPMEITHIPWWVDSPDGPKLLMVCAGAERPPQYIGILSI